MNHKSLFLVHLALTDFHWVLDDYGANTYGVYNGLRVLRESIMQLVRQIPIDSFDYVFVFSDHGFKFDKEFKNQNKSFLLNRDKSNVLMSIYKMGETNFKINDKLCSSIDVYPTIMKIIRKTYFGYARSLFSTDEAEFIISDEHGSFLLEVNQKIEYWALIKKDLIYLRSYYEYARDDGDLFDIEQDKFDNLLRQYSKSFDEVYKQLKILDLYKVMATDKSFYSNGRSRYIVENHDYLKRLIDKIRKVYWKIKNNK